VTVSSETLRSISRQDQLDDVLVWTKAPLLSGNELVPTSRLDEQRPACTDEIERRGDHPGVIRVTADRATVEVAAKAEDIELPLGPNPEPVGTSAASRTPTFERDARRARRP